MDNYLTIYEGFLCDAKGKTEFYEKEMTSKESGTGKSHIRAPHDRRRAFTALLAAAYILAFAAYGSYQAYVSYKEKL